MNPKNGKGTAPCRQAVRGVGVETGLACATVDSIASDERTVKSTMFLNAQIEVEAIRGIDKYDPEGPVEVTIENEGYETALVFSEQQLLALYVMIGKFFKTGRAEEIEDARVVGQNSFTVELSIFEDGISVELKPVEDDFPDMAELTLKDPTGKRANITLNPSLARAIIEKLNGFLAAEKALNWIRA
jgi:hypothetical protein